MAERTMLLRNVPKDCSADQISQEFKQFTVKRIMNEAPTTGRAYIEFYDPSDIEVVAAKYPDCVIPALNSAELQLVEAGFNWQQIFAEGNEQATFEVNEKCLVRLKNCNNVKDIDEGTVRSVFKKFAIGKIVKFGEKNQIILQFLSEDDLELLDITFEDNLVPGLGNNAVIDLEEGVSKQLFIQQYYATQPKSESIFLQKVDKVQPVESKEVKRQVNRQQYQDYRETMEEKQEAERLRILAEETNEVKRSFNRQQYQEYRQTFEEQQETQRLQRQAEAIEREELLRRQQGERKKKQEEEARKIAEETTRRQAEENAKKQLQEKFRREAEEHARKIEAAKKQAEAKEAELLRAKNEGEERARKFYQQKLRKAEEQARIEAEAKIRQEAAKKQAENLRKSQAALEEKARLQKQQQLRKKEEEARLAKAALEEKARVQKQNQQRLRREEEIGLAKELEKQKDKLTDAIKGEAKAAQSELEKLIEYQRIQKVFKGEGVIKVDSSPKKQIHLPLINTLTPVIPKDLFKVEIEAGKGAQIRYPEIDVMASRGIAFSSSLPTHFMTLVLLGWVYYVLMH